MNDTIVLQVRRTIGASAERLFEAWTTPAQLRQWWGPAGVRCSEAQVDLRVGGHYFIDNTLPDGSVLRIEGEFERVSPPRQLVYTWRMAPTPTATDERVTVTFSPCEGGTEVSVLHERIASTEARDRHEHGWLGCLDGLVELVDGAAADPTSA